MGKQRRKERPERLRPVSYDRIAESLVDRGLASPLILDKPRRGASTVAGRVPESVRAAAST